MPVVELIVFGTTGFDAWSMRLAAARLVARSLLDTSTVPRGYTIDRLRDELALRIAAIPEFRAKVAGSQLNLDYPVWVEEDAFDLDRHLLRIGMSSPEGRRELAEVCGTSRRLRWNATGRCGRCR